MKIKSTIKDVENSYLIQTKNEIGITLIALVITIIVLLILVGVTIATLTGNNGILTKTNEAKKRNKIGEEIEVIKLAYNGVKARNLGGKVDAKQLNEQFIINGREDIYANSSNPIIVIFDSGRTYEINANGTITEGKLLITLEQAKDNSMLEKKTNSKIKLNDGIVTIPAGFKIAQDSGNTVEDGIVIVDINQNEFVWVPVRNINDMAQCSIAGGNCNLQLENEQIICKTKEHNNNTKIVGKLYAIGTGNKFNINLSNTTYVENNGIREPDVVLNYDNNLDNLNIIKGILSKEDEEKYADITSFKNTMQEDYNQMIKSVNAYNGFYISRYEMSKSDNDIAQSKKNSIALTSDNDNSEEKVNGNTWYGLYAYGKTYTNPKIDSVESSMIWGSQYDTVMRWIAQGKNEIDVTQTYDAIKNTNAVMTGAKESQKDIIRNIYDLYGGRYEWTIEAGGINSRINRGGSHYHSNSPSSRNGSDLLSTSSYGSSRITLYIK